MKAIIAVLFVFSFVCTQAIFIITVYEDECIREMNADKNEISEAYSQDFFPEDNQMLKDVLSCGWRKEGILDEDGNIVRENFRQFLIRNFAEAPGSNLLFAVVVAEENIRHCGGVRGDDPGDTAVKMSNCMLRRILETQIIRGEI